MINFTVSDAAIACFCALAAVVVVCRTLIQLRRDEDRQ